nr:unnamed protein product [Digitaria exilis]
MATMEEEFGIVAGLELLLDDDDDGEEDEEEEHDDGDVVGRLGEAGHLQLDDVYDEEVHGEQDGCVEEEEESLSLAAGRPCTGVRPRHDADGGDEDERDGSGEPRHEEHELGAVVVGAIDGTVDLGEDGAAEADESFEQAEHDATVLGEVLDGGDERAGVGERLGVGAHGDVEAHEPHGRARGAARDGEVDHEVAGEVHAGAAGEDDPGWGDLVDEPREDAHVGAHVLEEAQRVERLLVMPKMYVPPAAAMIRIDAKNMNQRPRITCSAKRIVPGASEPGPPNAMAVGTPAGLVVLGTATRRHKRLVSIEVATNTCVS